MKWSGKIGWGVLSVALTACIVAHESSACTAILVGKKASETGRVIVAHNEDNRAGTFMRYAFLPKREEGLIQSTAS